MSSSMMDRGDSHVVWYLGCAMLSQGATGVGVLQKPLREMYFAHRKAGEKAASLQEKHMVISNGGMTLSHMEAGQRYQEVTYNMSDIILWDAVQFITVKDKKKINCAFEPLDNDHSRCKDNLYVALDKKYHFLATLRHPAMLCLVLRRPGRVKALDVHVYVCRNPDEALALVRALNHAHVSHHHNQATDKGVFGYNPFKDVPAGGGRLGGNTPGVPAVTRHSSLSNLLDATTKRAAHVVSSPNGSGASLSQNQGADDSRSGNGLNKQLSASRVCLLTQEHFTPAKPKEPEFETDSVGRQVQNDTTGSSGNELSRSKSVDGDDIVHKGIKQTESIDSTRSKSRIYQKDSLDSNKSYGRERIHQKDSLDSTRSRSSQEEFHTPEHGYRYTSHIDSSLGRDSAIGSQDQLTSPTNSLGGSQPASLASVVVGSLASSPHSRGQDSGFNSAVDTAEESSTRGSTKGGKDKKKDKKEKSSKKESKKEKKDKKDSKDRKKTKDFKGSRENLDVNEEPQQIVPKSRGKILVKVLPTPITSPPSEDTPSSKLGEGYSLLSGSAGPPPGHLPPRRRYVDSPEYQRPYVGSPGSPPMHQRSVSREPDLDYDYEVDIGNLAMFEARSDSSGPSGRPLPPRSPSSSYRSAQSGRSSRQRREVPSPTYDHIPIHQLRPPKDPGYLDQPPKLPERSDSGQSDYASSQGDVRSVYRDSEVSPLRPVAMVPPHKVTGVRVLPDQDHHVHINQQKPQRPRSIFDSPEYEEAGLRRRSQSQDFFMDRLERNYAPENDYMEYSPTKNKYEDNWQFKSSIRGGMKEYEGHTPSEAPPIPPHPHQNRGGDRGGKEPVGGEKLLLNQKKDAEIASVMQNLKFGYHSENRTLMPGAPGGMNFERSLGYFP